MTGIESIRIDLSEEEDQTQNADANGGRMEELEERIAPAGMVEYIILVGVVALLGIVA